MQVTLEKTKGIHFQFHTQVGGVEIKQSDWGVKDEADIRFIKNKPSVLISEPINNVLDILKD